MSPRMRNAALYCLLALSACRPGPGLDKQPPVDLAAASGPTPSEFNQESELLAAWPARIRENWQAGEDGFFTGVAGARLHYHVVRAASEAGSVVVVPGRTEPAIKYAELAEDLARHGYTSWVLDVRGQGESDRLTQNPEQGYVEYFADYVEDLELFVRDVVRPAGGKKPYLLAHSTGGLVALAHADAYPERFVAMAMTAPALEVDTGSFPPLVAASLATTMCSTTGGAAYVPGGEDYVDETEFVPNDVTHSQARWEWKHVLQREDPSLRIGSATYRWVCEAFTLGSYVQHVGRYNVTPLLVFQAGQDTVVRSPAETRYCDSAPRCQLTVFDEGLHELFQEVDPIRNVALSQSLRFFAAFPE